MASTWNILHHSEPKFSTNQTQKPRSIVSHSPVSSVGLSGPRHVTIWLLKRSLLLLTKINILTQYEDCLAPIVGYSKRWSCDLDLWLINLPDATSLKTAGSLSLSSYSAFCALALWDLLSWPSTFWAQSWAAIIATTLPSTLGFLKLFILEFSAPQDGRTDKQRAMRNVVS